MFFHSRSSTYVWAIVASLRSMKRTDCFSDFVSSGVGIWFSSPPKKRNDNNGFLWNLRKPGMYQPAVKLSQLESEIFSSKYHSTGDIQRSTCQSVGGLLLLSCDFLGHLPGERMPYTVTQAALVTGSCGSGKTAGVRKLRRKDLRILAQLTRDVES